ncbi:MAG: alpha/beta fold hydrolase [Alphaproteobacteria bacterium]
MIQPPAYKSVGVGPRTVVFLHGIGGNRHSFDDQLPYFASGWRAVAWDMPGYGDSRHTGPLSFALLADALAALVDKLKAPRVAVVGHSLGGMIAQEFAARYPNRLSALVLFATSAAFGGKDDTFKNQFLAARLAPLDRGLTPADFAADVVGPMFGDATSAEIKARAVASMAAIKPDAYRAAVNCIVTFDRRAELKNIKCPTLVLAAERDPLAPPKSMQRMAADIPGARFETLPGVGHLANFEAPSLFNATVRTFLDTAIAKRSA